MFLKIGLSRFRSYWLFHPPPLPSLEITERSSTSSLSSSSSSSSSVSLSFFLSLSLSLSLVGSPGRDIFVCFLTIKVFFSLSLLLFYYTVTPFVFFCSLVVFAVDIHASHKRTRFVTSLEKQTREKFARVKKQNQKNTLFFVHRRTFHQLQLLFSHLCHTPIKLVRASLLSPPPPSSLPALFFYALMLLPAVTLRAKCRKCAP